MKTTRTQNLMAAALAAVALVGLTIPNKKRPRPAGLCKHLIVNAPNSPKMEHLT